MGFLSTNCFRTLHSRWLRDLGGAGAAESGRKRTLPSTREFKCFLYIDKDGSCGDRGFDEGSNSSRIS